MMDKQDVESMFKKINSGIWEAKKWRAKQIMKGVWTAIWTVTIFPLILFWMFLNEEI